MANNKMQILIDKYEIIVKSIIKYRFIISKVSPKIINF